MTTESKEKAIRTVKIEEFRAGKKAFISTGVSKVKVTKDGEPICYEIPIQSTGISELIDSFASNAPQPPVKNILVTPDSEMGRDLKLSRKEWIKIPDLSDLAYIQAKEEHNTKVATAVLLKGMVVKIKDEKGEVVENQDKQIEILKSMGMSSDQFAQIVGDIQSLTRWSDEDKQRFLE